MYDIWSFLLQTLSISGVAVLLLIIKALFRDKLPPKWHFAVWGILGIMILIPAGWNGNYVLVNWQLVVEVIKNVCKDYSFTKVLFPIPVITSVPATILQWVFVAYIVGVVIHLIKYAAAYVRLRLSLRGGKELKETIHENVLKIAKEQKVKVKRIVAIEGLPSAFVCGILQPVLVLPADQEVDDKVILHELLHLKYKDTIWSIVVCLLRSLHWCNPLLIYCADQAINDMEARCDQHVLEQLEGEARRDYGRILLSMANERFAKTPGSTCVNNGGKNIRKRIEAIARFKKYPAGMGLVSGCAILLLLVSLVMGVQASSLYDSGNAIQLSIASARSTPCTTPAGAFDTYAKAVLKQNGILRLMCAPEQFQQTIINEILENEKNGRFPNWDKGLQEWPNVQNGYHIYNLKKEEHDVYEGLLVIELNYPPNGKPEEEGVIYLAVQNVRVQKEQGRWVAAPLDNFAYIETLETNREWGCTDLPGISYVAATEDFGVEIKVQTIHVVDYQLGDIKPDAQFTMAYRTRTSYCTHFGSQEERNLITQIGLSADPVFASEDSDGGSNQSSRALSQGWEGTVILGGGGSGMSPGDEIMLPQYYEAKLYVNDKFVSQFNMYPSEGVVE